MTKRMTFTPNDVEQEFITTYKQTYGLEKPQEVLRVGLAVLQEDELVRAYDRAARRTRLEPGEGRRELEATVEGREPTRDEDSEAFEDDVARTQTPLPNHPEEDPQ